MSGFTAEQRLGWLQNIILELDLSTYPNLLQRMGFDADEFCAEGDVTLGECFDRAIDARLARDEWPTPAADQNLRTRRMARIKRGKA